MTGPRTQHRLRTGTSRPASVPLRQGGPGIPGEPVTLLTYQTSECTAQNRHQGHCPGVSRVNLCPGAWLGLGAILSSGGKHHPQGSADPWLVGRRLPCVPGNKRGGVHYLPLPPEPEGKAASRQSRQLPRLPAQHQAVIPPGPLSASLGNYSLLCTVLFAQVWLIQQ